MSALQQVLQEIKASRYRRFQQSSVFSSVLIPTTPSRTATCAVTDPNIANVLSTPASSQISSKRSFFPTTAELFSFLCLKNPGQILPPTASPQLQQLATDAAKTMTNIWASSTWSNRLYLVERLTEFRVQHNLQQDNSDLALDWSILLFVQATEVSPASKLTYVKSLAALYRRQGRELPLCSLLATALQGTATIPTHQAIPATDHHVDRMMMRAVMESHPNLELAIFIMWKTASRADEVLRLTKEQIISASPEMIVVEWLSKTKTTRLDPWRTSAWTVIMHEAPMTHYVDIINNLQPEEPILDWTTPQFAAWMNRDEATKHLTAQSIKRGALTILSHMVLGGLLDISLIPRLAKHKVEFDVFPTTTLRYLSDRVTLARLLRTQEATKLLPCNPRSTPEVAPPNRDPPLPLPQPHQQRRRGRPTLQEVAARQVIAQHQQQRSLTPPPRPFSRSPLNSDLPGDTIAERIRRRHEAHLL